MKFADKLKKLSTRKECIVVIDYKCGNCGNHASPVRHEDGNITAKCCDAPVFDGIDFEAEGFTLRDMSGVMRDAYEADSQRRVKFKGGNPDLNTLDNRGKRALTLAMTVVNDETDELAWDWKNKEDLNQINKLGSAMIEPLIDAALDLCGLSQEAKDDAAKKSSLEEASETG